MSDVHGKVDVYRVVYVGGEGNVQAIVLSEPTEGKSYEEGQMVTFVGALVCEGRDDDGLIPHRELEEGDDQLEGQDYLNAYGITWHWQK